MKPRPDPLLPVPSIDDAVALAARIKALGNGQVPLCALFAFETMLATFDQIKDRITGFSGFTGQDEQKSCSSCQS